MAKSKKRVIETTEEPRSSSTETRVYSADDVGDDSSLLRSVIVVALLVLGLFLLFNLTSGLRDSDNGDKAAEGNETSEVEESDEATEEDESKAEDTGSATQPVNTSVNETDDAYSYTVGTGESYTTMARRAIASIDNRLTPAERVAAETKIVNDAGGQWLSEGQNLDLTKDTVRAAVDWAKGLSDEQKAAWQPYADMVVW